MKTYLKALAGALSAVAMAGSASAITIDGVTWQSGDVTVNGGFGVAFFAHDQVSPVEIAGAGSTATTYNMNSASIFRGAAGIQPGPAANTNIGIGDGLHAFGKVATFAGLPPGTDLYYVFQGASIASLSGAVLGGKGVISGSMSPFEILLYALPAGTIANADTAACSTATNTSPTVQPSACQPIMTAIAGANANLFLKLTSVNSSATTAFAQYELRQTGAQAVGDNGFGSTQSISFTDAFFNVTGGDAAGYFQTQQFQINATTAADAQQSGTAIGNQTPASGRPADTDPKLYGFNLLIQTNSIPEPGTLALLGLGLVGAAYAGRRRRKAA